MSVWIGKSIVFIGLVHSIFGFVVFRSTLSELFVGGIFNTVNGETDRELAFWFLFFGFMAIIVGSVVDWCERKVGEIPGFLGWSLLALTVAIVAIMPVSGGWAVFVPAIGSIYRSSMRLDIDGKFPL